jgi:methionyl aminopeptidase
MMLKKRIELKSEKEIAQMRQAGKMAGQVLEELGKLVAPGVTTKDLDVHSHKLIKQLGGIPTFLNYRGYTATICSSVNEEVVHGIPSAKRVLREGDLVSIDVGVTYDGFVGDTAASFGVGVLAPEKQMLLDVTRESLNSGIRQMKAGRRLGDVSHAIQVHAERNGFGVVRDFVGHGIGRQMHEEPAVPNYGEAGAGIRLEVGLVLALEPMVTEGHWTVKVLDDGWTVVTEDGKWAAHFEHTVAVTEAGPEILTVRPSMKN